jgi:hypothetical protein
VALAAQLQHAEEEIQEVDPVQAAVQEIHNLLNVLLHWGT